MPKFSWKLNGKSGKIIEGTIRSTECNLTLCHSDAQICSSCNNLVKDESFQKRVKRSREDNREKFSNKSCKNIQFLKGKQKVEKILHYRRKCDLQRLKIHTLSKRLARAHASKKTMFSKFTENVNRGDVSAIISDLSLAHKKGLLDGKSKILGFIANITRNFRRKSPPKGEPSDNTFSVITQRASLTVSSVTWPVLLRLLKNRRK